MDLKDKIAELLPLPAQIEKRNKIASSILSLVSEEVEIMKLDHPPSGYGAGYNDALNEVLDLVKGGEHE